ncbi:condensation domain-containing protein [Kordia sp.]|uniref:condensation domain-containing protein n=1 Tax=Kordia sp. TaxID=1965332 RepID=UPI003B592CE9
MMTTKTITQLSLNQEYFLKEPNSVGIMGPFALGIIPKEELPILIRSFLKTVPVLCVEIFKEGDTYVQKEIDPEQVKFELECKTISKNQGFKTIENIVLNFLSNTYNFDGGELIRVIAVTNEERGDTSIVIGIHHILTDMYTNMILEENLYTFFQQKPMQQIKLTNCDYQEWQQQFLTSEKALKSIDFWKKNINTTNCEGQPFKKNLNSNDRNYIYDTFKLQISHEKLNEFHSILTSLRIPISAFFLAMHQELIQLIFGEVKGLQLIRVSGREQTMADFDIQNVHGMVSNTIPLVLQPLQDNFKSNAIKIFSEYCRARQHQIIPYVLIEKEIRESHNMIIDDCSFGVYNFKSFEQSFETMTGMSETREDKIFHYNDLCNFEVNAYNNVINITVSLTKSMSKRLPESFNLFDFMLEKIDN